MAIFGSIPTIRGQAPDTPAFTAAWRYVAELVRSGSDVGARVASLTAGDSRRQELEAGVFAIEQAYDTKPRAEGFFESHRKFIDIQLVVSGEETIEVIDAARATVREPYDGARDLVIYRDAAAASAVRLGAGEAAVFFPADVHMPSLRTGAQATLVRKVVLKLPVGG